jgi:aryl-alcohol dehydrogenase-like predicted oxidoreductase
VISVAIQGTDLTVSRLSFGTASLHHLFRSKQRQNLLITAVEAGFTHLDTSPFYGYGLAETEIGFLPKNYAKKVTIASKIGLYPPEGSSPNSALVVARKAIGRILPKASLPVTDWSLTRAQVSLDSTLKRIRRDCLDILYLHEPVYGCVDEDELLVWLENQKKVGKIRQWGLAGESSRFGGWLNSGDPLAQILQIRRPLGDVGVAPAAIARPNQFSFGYLSSAKVRVPNSDVTAVLSKALHLHPEGSIIVSSRNISRVKLLAKVALCIPK